VLLFGLSIGLPASSAALELLVVSRHLPNVTRTHSVEEKTDKTDKNWLPRQRPLRDRKADCRAFIYSHSSTNPANLVKIGPADVETIGLREIVKNK